MEGTINNLRNSKLLSMPFDVKISPNPTASDFKLKIITDAIVIKTGHSIHRILNYNENKIIKILNPGNWFFRFYISGYWTSNHRKFNSKANP